MDSQAKGGGVEAKAADDAKLISFDEAGFTGPELLNEDQPYFVYASHAMDEAESATLVERLRADFRLEGAELKASKLKKRGSWPDIVETLCDVTAARASVVTFEKKLVLAGKFFEYFFEPVLAENSAVFYGVDFHRYISHALYELIKGSKLDYGRLAEQMQAFMRRFDPADAPDLFNPAGEHPIEMQRILQFCQGYAAEIAENTSILRPEVNDIGKWTLDLTTTALFSLLFFGWGHRYPRLRLLCDDSKPLAAGIDIFNSRIGVMAGAAVTDGKTIHEIKGNLVEPVNFGSSAQLMSLQVADLLAGMTMDVCIRKKDAPVAARQWVERHRMQSHSVEYDIDYVKPNEPTVRVGREILKELALRAQAHNDPLAGMNDFVRKTCDRFIRR